MSLLQTTGDNDATMNAARSRASLLSQPRPLEDVGPLFQNATATLADMIVSPAIRQQTGGGGGGYGSGSKGSGKVING